jgi:G3E family GTPase
MNMKTEIEIVTGFLGSGKTFFIDNLLENTLVPGEIVLIVQCEVGEKGINSSKYQKNKVLIKEHDPSKALTLAYLKQMIKFYNPHRIIIEHNGMRMLGETLSLFNEEELENLCLDPVIYHTADALTFNMFINNMKELIEPFIYHSNLVVLNNCKSINLEERKGLIKKIREINYNTFIISIQSIDELHSALNKAEVLADGVVKSFKINFNSIIARKKK